MRIPTVAIAVWSLLLTGIGHAESIGPEPVLLWPEGAPGALGTEPRDRPEIRIYAPESAVATGTAIVICPGGGYGILATDHEGHQVAKWANSIGVTGVVLKYRLSPHYRHPAPLQDVQRAIRHVRAHAKDLQVAPNRIGVLGFSAGGHLASTAATHFDMGIATSADAVERQSSRPDFAVLCYPVISLTEPFAHTGSARNLLGDAASDELRKSLSNETQVTPATPPTFLWHTGEDTAVPVENSLAFYAACRKANVPAELHIYQNGPHGVGLAPADPAVFGWKDRLADWLKTNGLLADVRRVPVQGQVQVNGVPLRWGMIAFEPRQKHAPRAWAMVSNGRFALKAASGICVGTNDVLIYDLGKVEPFPTVEDYRRLDRKQLVVEAAETGNNFDFNLMP